jgi:hypothetical protein
MTTSLEKLMATQARNTETLHKLPIKHRVAFAATCCERLMPNFYACALVYEIENHHLVQAGVDNLWGYLGGELWQETEINEFLQVLDSFASEIENFASTIYSELALHTLDAIRNTVRGCLADTGKNLEEVITITINAIDLYLRNVNYPSTEFFSATEQTAFDEWIYQAPLYTTELKQEQADLELLSSSKTLSIDLLMKLRSDAKRIGMKPIENGLIPDPRFKRD